VQVALQSIWIGIGLSVALMLAAAAGYVPAIVGALTQELVDLATILNALRSLGPGRRSAGSPVRREEGARRAPLRG
jgi:cation transport ATPase